MVYSKESLKGKSVKDLGLLIGSWEGVKDNDLYEEHWMSAVHGNMTGMFRWIKEGKVYIYEIMALIEKDDEVQFYLRHFDKKFHGHEAKDAPMVFHLTEIKGTRAVFVSEEKPDNGFIAYEVMGGDFLKFTDHKQDGSVAFELVFTRQMRGH
jgi:hypothetical protein